MKQLYEFRADGTGTIRDRIAIVHFKYDFSGNEMTMTVTQAEILGKKENLPPGNENKIRVTRTGNTLRMKDLHGFKNDREWSLHKID